MVLSNNRKKRANVTIDELFKRPRPNRPTNEDQDLLLAMRLSQQEHVNEQKKLLDKYSSLSRKQFESVPSPISKTKRLIKTDAEEYGDNYNDDERVEDFTDEEEDQWFQTISTRPQPPVKKGAPKLKLVQNKSKYIPKASKAPTATSTSASSTSTRTRNKNAIKQEDDEMMLEIDTNVDEWLDAKIEKIEKTDMVEITDIDAYLGEIEDKVLPVITIDDEEEEEQGNATQLIACPLCQKTFEQGNAIQEHAAKCNNMVSDTDSDSDSDCDIIDLINPANNVISKQTYTEEAEEDDGYLSPLEGFTSIQNDQNEAFNPYFEQLQYKPKATRATRGTTKRSTPARRGRGGGGGKSKFKWFKKKKKS